MHEKPAIQCQQCLDVFEIMQNIFRFFNSKDAEIMASSKYGEKKLKMYMDHVHRAVVQRKRIHEAWKKSVLLSYEKSANIHGLQDEDPAVMISTGLNGFLWDTWYHMALCWSVLQR